MKHGQRTGVGSNPNKIYNCSTGIWTAAYSHSSSGNANQSCSGTPTHGMVGWTAGVKDRGTQMGAGASGTCWRRETLVQGVYNDAAPLQKSLAVGRAQNVKRRVTAPRDHPTRSRNTGTQSFVTRGDEKVPTTQTSVTDAQTNNTWYLLICD